MMDIESRREIIATRIREARRMSGLSQSRVAAFLGLQRPAVSEIEAGNRKVSAEEIVALAKMFDVAANWLLGEGEDSVELHDIHLQLAARELKNLQKSDLDRLLKVLASIRE